MKPFPAQKKFRLDDDLRFVSSVHFVLQREEGSLILRSHECRFKDAVRRPVGRPEKRKNSRLILVAGGGVECGFSGYKVRRGK